MCCIDRLNPQHTPAPPHLDLSDRFRDTALYSLLTFLAVFDYWTYIKWGTPQRLSPGILRLFEHSLLQASNQIANTAP